MWIEDTIAVDGNVNFPAQMAMWIEDIIAAVHQSANDDESCLIFIQSRGAAAAIASAGACAQPFDAKCKSCPLIFRKYVSSQHLTSKMEYHWQNFLWM